MMTSHQPDDRLEEQLRSLATDLRFPETPDIAARIRPVTGHRSSGSHRIWYALATIALALILVATPPVRAAVWQIFDAVGIDIRVGEERGAELRLETLDAAAFGEPVTLSEAESAFGRPLSFPTEVLPAEPDAVYIYQPSPGGLISVTFVYGATDDLPALPDSDIGAILTQITGPSDSPYLVKMVLPTSAGEPVRTDAGAAYWVEDGQLEVQPIGSSRYSAHVLVWLDGITAYRLESMLDQPTSIRIAESMEPLEVGNQYAFLAVQVNEMRRMRRGDNG